MNRTTSLKLFSFSHRLAAHSLLLALSLLLLPLGTLAIAADQSVTTTATSGAGSLPQAVADVGDGEDVIFQPTVAGETITLSSDLDVNRSMNFTNNTGGGVTVDLGGNRMTVADGSVIGLASSLTIETTNASANASAIYSYSNCTIDKFSGAISATSVDGRAKGLNAQKISISDGFSGYISASSTNGRAYGIEFYDSIDIAGGLSGTITATSNEDSASGLNGSAMNISGGLSGNITANSNDGRAYGILSYDSVSITGGLSGTISATSGSDYSRCIIANYIGIDGGLSGTITATSARSSYPYACGMLSYGRIDGGNADTPLVITGSVIARTDSGGTSWAAIQGSGINLKLDEGGTLSAKSAVLSTGTAEDRVELVAGCTVVGDINLGNGNNDVLILSGTNGYTMYDDDIYGVENINATGGNWVLNKRISGDVALNISGGTLTLNDSNYYTGGTTVSGGKLIINGQITGDLNITGGSVGGTGQIGNLVNSGTLAPGNSIGTLNVGGNYTQNVGSTLEVEVNDAGQSDLVDVGGTATIHGGAIDVQAESGTYTLGQTYTVLDADGGVNGTFDALFDNLADYNFRLVYNANSVQLVLVEGYTALAQTSNQLSVANYLDDYAGSATGDFRSIMGRINVLSASEARAAFDSMSGELYGSLSTVGIENTDRFLRTVASRLRARSLAGRFTYETSDTWEDSSSDQTLARGQDTCASERVNRWLPWAEGYGVGAKIASDGNASGLEYSVGGMTYGFESELDEHTLLGFMAGYSKTFVNLDALENHGEIKSAQAGLYMNHHSDVGYATGIAAYGYNAYDTWRRIQIGSLARLARAEYEGNEFSFYFETGRNFQCQVVYLQPFVALQYIQLHQNGFDESGADSVNLSVGGIGADSFRGLLGTRLVGCFQTNTGQACTIEGRALWRHEFLNEARVLDAEFAGQPDGSFAISGVNVDRDAAILGGGLTYCLTKNAKLYGNYDLLFSQNYAAHTSSAGLMLAW